MIDDGMPKLPCSSGPATRCDPPLRSASFFGRVPGTTLTLSPATTRLVKLFTCLLDERASGARFLPGDASTRRSTASTRAVELHGGFPCPHCPGGTSFEWRRFSSRTGRFRATRTRSGTRSVRSEVGSLQIFYVFIISVSYLNINIYCACDPAGSVRVHGLRYGQVPQFTQRDRGFAGGGCRPAVVAVAAVTAVLTSGAGGLPWTLQ